MQTTMISDIPDEILGIILKNLSAKDLIRANQVNHRWNRISYSSWPQKVDLSKFLLKFREHWRSVRKILSSNNKALLILCHKVDRRSFHSITNDMLKSGLDSDRWKYGHFLTVPMMKDIREKSTRLLSLSLHDQPFNAIKLHFLPRTLEFLDLTESYLPNDFFADNTNKQPLPHLTGLNIGWCHILSTNDRVIHDICDRWPRLTSLDIYCFDNAGKALEIVGSRLIHLRHLEASCVDVNDSHTDPAENDGRSVCENLKHLESLHLASTFVNYDNLIESLVKLPKLKKLDVSGNLTMNEQNLMRLTELKTLEFLNIDDCEVYPEILQAIHPNGKNLTVEWSQWED